MVQLFKKITDYIKGQQCYVDKTYWLLFGTLIIVAIIALFSASSSLAYKADSALEPVANQILFMLFGVVVAFVLQFVPSKWIRILGYAGFVVSFVLLMLTYTPLGVTHNGARRWLCLAGIEFQPSEIAKLTLLIVISDLLSRIKNPKDEKKYFFAALGATIFICLPILPSNLSTVILLGGVIFLLLFLARVNMKYVGALLLTAMALMVAGYFVVEYCYIKPHKEIGEKNIMKRAITWVSRVDDVLEKHKEPDTAEFQITDANCQQAYAKVAIARGGKSPVGVLPGNSTVRDYLPLAFADYIFAIIVEETGFVGALMLILLYVAILFRACLTSSKYADYFAMLMVMGLALMITCQALVSMLVVVGIGPVTGQPLPMISRGGTSVVVTSVYFGIMMGVAREQNELHARQQATTDASRETVPEIELD